MARAAPPPAPRRCGADRADRRERNPIVGTSSGEHVQDMGLGSDREQHSRVRRSIEQAARSRKGHPPPVSNHSVRPDPTTDQFDGATNPRRDLVGGERHHDVDASCDRTGPKLMREPTPLPPSAWHFPPAEEADEYGVVGIGADLEPATIIGAYRHGLFPMPISAEGEREVIAWWSPHTRGVLEFDDLVVSRSLRRSCRRYDVTVNADFDAVIGACATIDRDGGWISPSIRAAYRRLHRLGWAHSIETWDDGVLVGGLYGLQINGLFAGESMFHTATDASKVALVALVSALEDTGATFIDVQWPTDHLATLGVSEITQGSYFTRLREALASPARSLASGSTPAWVAKSPRYLDRTQQRPMVQKPSATQ